MELTNPAELLGWDQQKFIEVRGLIHSEMGRKILDEQLKKIRGLQEKYKRLRFNDTADVYRATRRNRIKKHVELLGCVAILEVSRFLDTDVINRILKEGPSEIDRILERNK